MPQDLAYCINVVKAIATTTLNNNNNAKASTSDRVKIIRIISLITILAIFAIAIIHLTKKADNEKSEPLTQTHNAPKESNLAVVDIQQGTTSKLTALAPLSQGLLIKKSWPDIELQGDLALHIDNLFEQYQSGDLKAGYILASNLQRCRGSVVKTLKDLNKNIEQAYELQEKYDLYKQGQLANHIEHLKETFHFCADIPEQTLNKELEIFDTLASQDYVPAQLSYGLRFDDWSQEQIDQYSKQLSQEQIQHSLLLQKKAKEYLNKAAFNGSSMALSLLSAKHRQTQPKDLVNALSFTLALLHITRNSHFVAEQEKIELTLKKQMNYQQINDAELKSKHIVSTIMHNGVIYDH